MPNGLHSKQQTSRARPPNLARRASQALDETIRAGARTYDRERDLPRLIRIEPCASQDESVRLLETIVGRLERALRAERSRARGGHWTYDLNRHIALHQAHLAEKQRLAALRARRR